MTTKVEQRPLDAANDAPRPVRLTTSKPPRCANCRGRVIPEHMEVLLGR